MARNEGKSIMRAGIAAFFVAAFIFAMICIAPSAPAAPNQPAAAAATTQTQPTEVSQVVRFMDARRVGILSAVCKAANGTNQPVYEPGVAINICSPACDQTSTVYMWNSARDALKLLPDKDGKGKFARGDYMKLFIDPDNKSNRITMLKDIEPYPIVAGEDHPNTYILKDVAQSKGPGQSEYIKINTNKLGRDYSFAIPVKLHNGVDADGNSARIAEITRSYKPGQLMKLMPSGMFAGLPALVDVQKYGPVVKGVMDGVRKVTDDKGEFDSVIVDVEGKKKELPIQKVMMLTNPKEQQPKVVTDPELLIVAKSIPKGKEVEIAPIFDVFNNIFINGIHAVPAVPLAVGMSGVGGGGGDNCIAYILVGTCQAYIANISQTAGTSAVGNNYTVGWINSGSCFVVYDAVVEVNR